MKVGVICSAGGSAFFKAAELAMESGLLGTDDLLVITDRDCGAEDTSRDRGIAHVRIDDPDRAGFSQRAAERLDSFGCNLALLIFSRLVSCELYAQFPTLNVHPALLPAFPGFNALGQASRAGVRFLGATLHVVTEGVDDGPIVSQVVSPLVADDLAHLSYVQKSYLLLVAMDLFRNDLIKVDPASQTFTLKQGIRSTFSANPALQTGPVVAGFRRFQDSLARQMLQP